MHRAHKIRLYPTKHQKQQLAKTAGTARYVYNWTLMRWNEWYEASKAGEVTTKPSVYELSRIWTQEKPAWADEVCRSCQTRAILTVGAAFTNFFKGRAKHPSKHKKGVHDSAYITNDSVRLYGNKISLPKIGHVRMAEKLRFEGKILSYVISRELNEWYVSIAVDTSEDIRPRCTHQESVVGIDAGLKTPATASDDTTLELPLAKLKKLEAKRKYLQSLVDRSHRGSKNKQKKIVKRQRVQRKISNIRKDAVHKYTTAIAKNHGIVIIETLDINSMKEQAKKLPRAIRRSFNSSLMGELHRQLSYKCQLVIKVPKYYPSSKMCSRCGSIKEDLKVTDRTYVCPHCGATIDRDYNAAINLKNYYTAGSQR